MLRTVLGRQGTPRYWAESSLAINRNIHFCYLCYKISSRTVLENAAAKPHFYCKTLSILRVKLAWFDQIKQLPYSLASSRIFKDSVDKLESEVMVKVYPISARLYQQFSHHTVFYKQ